MSGRSVIVVEDEGSVTGAADGDLLVSQADRGPGQGAGGDEQLLWRRSGGSRRLGARLGRGSFRPGFLRPRGGGRPPSGARRRLAEQVGPGNSDGGDPEQPQDG